ncbi:MAG: hypothetical protein JWN86_1146 [Planctomycetota bacterium]|nr:hypothetical protein [Planctomycetota bacterium]
MSPPRTQIAAGFVLAAQSRVATCMLKWKTDPLYRQILDETRALWAKLASDARPELLRIEDRAPVPHEAPIFSGRVVDVWVLDDTGLRLVPILRREAHEPGATRGEFFRFGLIRFSINARRNRVDLEYQLGPTIHGDLSYDVEGEGSSLRLHAHTESLSA